MSESPPEPSNAVGIVSDDVSPLTQYQEDVLLLSKDLHQKNTATVQQRLEVTGEEFIENIILSRDAHEYPDPYLHALGDVELLKQYKEHVESVISEYEPASENEAEQCQEFLSRERKRANSQIARLTFPKPESHGLDTEFVFSVKKLKGVDLEHLDVLHKLYTLPLEKLRYLSAWFQVNASPEVTVESSQAILINSIRFAKGDPTISIANIIKRAEIDIPEQLIITDEDGNQLDIVEGVDETTIVNELELLVDKFPGFTTALAVANTTRITNWKVEDSGVNGEYAGSHMNISQLSHNPDDADYTVNVVAHEFFHAMQDALGCMAVNTKNDWVDFDASPDEWESLEFPQLPSSHPLPDIQSRMQHAWFEFRQSGTPLREYQQKNINECYAVAFEAYVESPRLLKNSQPKIYSIIEDMVVASPDEGNF